MGVGWADGIGPDRGKKVGRGSLREWALPGET